MHDDHKRQLYALVAGVLVLLGHAHTLAHESPAEKVATRLEAARVMEATLTTRGAGAGERQKLDTIYADLAAEFPAEARVRNAHAESLWRRNERARAMAQWELAEKLDPKNAVVLDHLADAWLAEGDVRRSAAFAARAVTSAPGNAAYHFALANIVFLFRHELTDASNPDSEAVLRRALTHFAEASRLAPSNSEYARAYAETFYSLPKPDWQTALAAWNHFLELTTEKDFAFVNLARIQLRLGKKRAAMECLEKIQAPEYKNVKHRLEAQIHRLETPSAMP